MSLKTNYANGETFGASDINATNVQINRNTNDIDLLGAAIDEIKIGAWTELATSTGSTSTTIALAGYSEVLVVADTIRNSAHHISSVVLPVACLYSSTSEVNLTGGGYGGSSGYTTAKACWINLSLTTIAGISAYISGTNYITSTTFKVFVR